VKYQSIQNGERLVKGSTIILKLSWAEKFKRYII
jgi:hypothetical protein